jgi:hypothetical protein
MRGRHARSHEQDTNAGGLAKTRAGDARGFITSKTCANYQQDASAHKCLVKYIEDEVRRHLHA